MRKIMKKVAILFAAISMLMLAASCQKESPLAEGKVKVTDVETGKVVFKGSFNVGANDRSLVKGLPIPEGQGVLLIEYETDGQKYRNHYLYGTSPFDFRSYQKWMTKAGIQL